MAATTTGALVSMQHLDRQGDETVNEDSKKTTDADAAILADFRRRFEHEFRGGGIDRVRVVVPGDAPGGYVMHVFETAEEAAAFLHRVSQKRTR